VPDVLALRLFARPGHEHRAHRFHGNRDWATLRVRIAITLAPKGGNLGGVLTVLGTALSDSVDQGEEVGLFIGGQGHVWFSLSFLIWQAKQGGRTKTLHTSHQTGRALAWKNTTSPGAVGFAGFGSGPAFTHRFPTLIP